MLIERGGKIVTREEIKKRLWPNDTIVDFDHSINVAIGILRRALGDSADSPQYIETLARRGYRLLVAAEWLSSATDPPGGEPARAQALTGQGLIGKKISHYRVLEVIGGGGMGMVYQAEDLKLGRRVALKFLPEELASNPAALKLLEREAQMASTLNHPNICTIYEIEESEGQPFIAMELLDGETLSQRMATSEVHAVPLAALLDIAIQLCNGLQAAHDLGIIHRDIKPANILLTKPGSVKILDFGLAKLAASEEVAGKEPASNDTGARDPGGLHATLMPSGMAVGTPGYMSPEQVRKEPLDIRTDLFSFGLVLYEMAAGQRAFLGETRSAIHNAVLNQTPVPAHELNAAVPRGLDAVITGALEKDRSRRYQSAAEMREDLARVRAEPQPPRRHVRKWFAAAALLVVVATGLRLYWSLRSHMMLSDTDTIVLADISNQTGDPVFDDSLNTALRLGLEQTPYLNVLATDKVRGTLTLLKLSVTKVTPEIARQVCLKTNSKMAVTSSIEDAGNRFGIELNAIHCQSGTAVARVRKEVTSRNEIVRALGSAVAQLRGSLGEPAASVARFNKPLEEATSPSLEAVQSLVKGYTRHLAGDALGARPSYQRATELDPDFALAYAALGAANLNLGELAPATAALKKAYELRGRLSAPSRFRVEDLYYDIVTGEQEKAYAVVSQWVQTFPRDVVAHNNFARCLKLLGQPDQAAAEAREAARLLPTPWSYNFWIIQSALADRLNEAKSAVDEAEALKFDSSDLRSTRVLLAFLQRDESSQNEQWQWAVGKPDVGRFLAVHSSVEAYHGHFRTARLLMQQAIDSARSGTLPNDRLNEARAEAEVGNVLEARRLAAQALNRSPSRDRQLMLALVLARAGEVEQAQQLADSLDAAFPLHTSIQYYCLPTIRAAMKLQANDPAAAVELLRRTEKYELADPDSFSVLYPAYIRGLAYLQMHEGRPAAAEFKKLLAHPGLVGTSVTGALSQLQLARAERMMGDEAAARKSYEDFLTLWKTADSDIPIYVQAKAEYVELGRTRRGASNVRQ